MVSSHFRRTVGPPLLRSLRRSIQLAKNCRKFYVSLIISKWLFWSHVSTQIVDGKQTAEAEDSTSAVLELYW